MSILDRIKASFLRRELTALQAADRQERDQAQTTDDMMLHMSERVTKIVVLQNKIRKLEGWEEDEDEDSTYGPRIPSSLFIPSKQDNK